MAKYYVTTSIPYVNAKPHVGHAYEYVIADVLARWHKLKDDDVFFLTGTDENSQRNAQSAKEKGISTKQFVDENSKFFLDLCSSLNIEYDDFIRTTEERHIKVSKNIFKKIFDKGDIYKGKYEGWYCYGCEAFLTDKELVNGNCPDHNKKPEWIEEESYFFKMSKYEKKIIQLLKDNKLEIFPESKKNEIISRLEEQGLKDLSVSRSHVDWGIDVPFDKDHKIYVWMDALVNYISALGYPSNIKFKKYWPADLHVIGKGINWFHSVIWSSILLSSEIKLPKKIYVHGYLTLDGKKMSKSIGNVVDPLEIVNKYGADPLRYYFFRDIPSGEDGDFSEELLKERINNELANELGNLVSRILTLTEKNFKQGLKYKSYDKTLSSKLALKEIQKNIDSLKINQGLSLIMEFVKECNRYINNNKVWELKGEEFEIKIYSLLESLRIISVLLWPFLPETSEKMSKQLNIKLGKLKDCKFGVITKYNVKKEGILFKKID